MDEFKYIPNIKHFLLYLILFDACIQSIMVDMTCNCHLPSKDFHSALASLPKRKFLAVLTGAQRHRCSQPVSGPDSASLRIAVQ
jgi:hypothetical protein